LYTHIKAFNNEPYLASYSVPCVLASVCRGHGDENREQVD